MSAWAKRTKDRWEDVKRYLRILSHVTPGRGFNLAVNLLCAALKTRRVPGYPYVLRLDPTNACNFRCPLCPTGMRNYGRPPMMMPWETYTKVIRQVAPWVLRVWFYIWGEPLLHPELPRMIQYAARRGLSTNLSSNLSRLTPELARKLVTSGLEYIITSIDGADAPTYDTYRIGGDFDQVVENVKVLVQARQRALSSTPFIELQCLVTSDTENQLEKIETFALGLGVDRVRFMPVAIPFFPYRGEDFSSFEKWLPKNAESYKYTYEPGKPANQSPCFWLYEGLTLNPDGGVSPCCRSYYKDEDFGNVHDQSVRAIFNNEKFQRARSLFSEDPDWSGPKIVCDGCREFQQSLKK